MIDPISASGVKPPDQLFNLAAADMGPGQVTAADQHRFEAALGTDGVTATDGEGIRAGQVEAGDIWLKQPVAGDVQAPLPPTLGDSILNGLESFRGSWQGTMSEIQAAVSQDSMDPATLMSLQFQVQHTAVVTTLVINEVTALDQEITQLLKAS